MNRFLASLVLTAALAAPVLRAQDPSDTHLLRADDRLQFTIAEDPATGSSPMIVSVNAVGEAAFPVSRDSDIRLTLNVRGKSMAQVKEELGARLRDEYYEKATVRLNLDEKHLTPGKVIFTGEVRGVLPLSPDEPPLMLSEGILRLTYNDYADLSRVKVHRSDPQTRATTTTKVDVRKIIRDNARDLDIELKDGDRVEVPAKWIN